MKIFFTYSANADLPTRLIQSITNSRFTHCGIILDHQILDDWLITDSAAEAGGVRIHLWSKHSHMPHEIFEIDGISLPGHQLDQVREMLSIRYSYGKILLYPVRKYFGEQAFYRYMSLLNKFGLWNNPWSDGMWCSEFSYHFLFLMGVLKKEDIKLDPETITPEDLYQIALKNPQFKKVDV